MTKIVIKEDKATIIRKQYNTITDPKKKINMSAPIDSEKKPVNTDNAISTATTEAKPELHSSINPNAEENTGPVYTSKNPLMAAPPSSTTTQSLNAATTTASPETQQTPPPRSNPQTEPSTNNTQTTTAAAAAEQQTQGPSPLTMQTSSPKPPKAVDFTATDASIQGLLLQVVALQHNKIQQLNQLQQE